MRAVLCLHPLRVWRVHWAACGPPRRIVCAQIPHDYKPDSEAVFRELVADGDTSVRFFFAPAQFVHLNALADKLLREGVLSRIERVTASDATAIAGEVLRCLLPELQDEVTLVGPKGGNTGMLLLKRASDGRIILCINLGHFTHSTFTFRLEEADRIEARRAFNLRSVVTAGMLLDLRFNGLPMDQRPFAAVVEGFFGHSLKPTNEPHTASTLNNILAKYIVVNSEQHRANVAAVCAAKGNDDALAKLKGTMTPEQFAAASSSAAAIDTLHEEAHTRAVNEPSRVLVELRGPSNKRIFATTIRDVVHFIELRLHDIRHLTGENVWKEPAKPNRPAAGHSRCGDCMKEYKQGNTKSHKKNCRPSKAVVVWADRDCASESETRIRLSGSVIHTSAGLEWMPSSKFAAIMAKNEIVIVRVTQNADGIATVT